MINLNDESFDQKNGGAVKIFNTGIAGIVENVTMSLSKKSKEDHENAPEYKVVFTDEDGATCNNSFYYIKEDTQYQTVDQQIVKQGKVLKHLLHSCINPTFKIPNFNTPKEMLDGCMKALRENAVPGAKYRIFTNYGVKSSPKKYIQPRSWVPFIEAMSVVESRLSVSDLDAMSRLAPDEEPTQAAQTGADADADDWN